MKRLSMKSVLCLVLILVMAMAPMCASAASKTVQILKVSADGARMRADASLNYEIITSLKKGTRVIYTGRTSGAFCEVCTSSGELGYVYKEYLSSYGAAKRSQVYVADSSTTVYKRSGSSIKKLGTLSKGSVVLVFRTSGGWAYIKNLAGKGGYVKMSALSAVF